MRSGKREGHHHDAATHKIAELDGDREGDGNVFIFSHFNVLKTFFLLFTGKAEKVSHLRKEQCQNLEVV